MKKSLLLLLPLLTLGCQDVTGPKSRANASGKVFLAPRLMTTEGVDPAQVEFVHVKLLVGARDSVVLDTTYSWARKSVSLEVPVGRSYQLTLQGRNTDDPTGTWRWSGSVKGVVDSIDETIWADTVFIAQLPTPPLAVATGTYQTSVELPVSAVDGATVRCTLDGSDPTVLSPEWTAPLSVKSTRWLRARAFRTLADGTVLTSQAAERLYTVTDKAVPVGPMLSQEGGTFTVPTAVAVSVASGLVAEVSRDGYSFTPVVNDSETISYSQTLLVRSRTLDGTLASPVRAVSFLVKPATVTPAVTFSELGGSYRTSRLVGLASANSAAAIQYSWDGKTWIDYVAPVLVTDIKTLVTLRARAKATGLSLSPVSSVSFYIDP